MAKNDTVLLDGIIDQRVERALPSGKRDEVFEYLVLEQTLKDYDLSSDEIQFGWVDGNRDGGIDGFYTFVNGHLLQEPEDFVWPKSHSEVKLYLFTCKHAETFKEATVDKLIATLDEIFDLTKRPEELAKRYSADLITARQNFMLAYRKLSYNLERFQIAIFYASRGDASSVGKEVLQRSVQLRSNVLTYFSKCDVTFAFIGSQWLVDAYRRQKRYSLELPFAEVLARGERYVLLARLSDYYKFMIDEDGQLRRYLFDSNVRDFMGFNSVNSDILSTLEREDDTDFWWMNNGITMLASSATITGKQIQVSNIQIVNGLQTTESIFCHFTREPRSDERCVLIKIIVSQDESVRDGIIKATNNQTAVEIASLHATDRIQKDIEDVLLRSSLYYERRKNYYSNQGHAPNEIVTPLYVAAAYVALVQRRPQQATTLRSNFMRNATKYANVFDSNFPLQGWATISLICKAVDASLDKLRPTNRASERFLRGWRYIIAFIAVSRIIGRFDYSVDELCAIDTRLFNDEIFKKIYLDLMPLADQARTKYPWSSRQSIANAMDIYTRCEHVLGSDSYLFGERSRHAGGVLVDRELVERVADRVPPQPWKPGLHRRMADELGCSVEQYSAAVDELIHEGRLLKQQDGVLFDQAGNVVGFDAERVDAESLQLKIPRH